MEPPVELPMELRSRHLPCRNGHPAMPDCKCWSWAGLMGSVHPSAGLAHNYAVLRHLPSRILTAVDKFKRAGAIRKVAVQARGQTSGLGKSNDRISLARPDLDQRDPARGQQ